MNRLCSICGARVRNMNPKVDTCGPVCTSKKKELRGDRITGLCEFCRAPIFDHSQHCVECEQALHDFYA